MEKKKNIAASVRAKLKNKAKEKQVEFQNLLVRFGNERLLYRLSVSAYQNSFLLKGAALFAIWMGEPHRPTKDMDLLGCGKMTFRRSKTSFGKSVRLTARTVWNLL
jgi:hypothetical protein